MSLEKILIAEDDRQNRDLLVEYLNSAGYETVGVEDGDEALEHLQNNDVDVLIADIKMPKMDGISLLAKTKREKPGIMVLMITGHACVNTAVQAMKLGAEDYITKPVNLDELRLQIKKVIEKKTLKSENVVLKEQLKKTYRFDTIIGKSHKMEMVFRLIEKVADSDSTIIIYGESGVGKELIARAIHYNSHRSSYPLVPVNCGAIPEELLESELFGHEKGAFTGAHKSRVGRFELASNGTIFLDEIGDMSPNLQVKILRVLQEHEFERVGGVKPIKANIRVIAATHRELEKEVAKGRFREDLYYRLNVIPITVPPLRERKNDLPLLVSYFIDMFNRDKGKEISGISEGVLECFLRYNWPGNVRELQNMIERLVILRGSGEIAMEDLPEKLLIEGDQKSDHPVALPEDGASFNTMVTSYEKHLILHALKQTSGVKNKAAKLLNMNRTTLVEKMKKLQIKYK